MKHIIRPVPVLLTVISLVLGLFCYQFVSKSRGPTTTSNILLEYPESIDLGDRELGDLVMHKFTITNRSKDPILIDQIHTNCSCTGLERDENGSVRGIESLILEAGEAVPLILRISVRGAPVGAQMISRLHFHTNLPGCPDCQIESRARIVRGGIQSFPESISFGPIPVQTAARKTCDIVDFAMPPREIKSLVTTHPDLFGVRLLPPNEKISAIHDELPEKGTVIGKIEVITTAKHPGEINGEIFVYLKGDDNPCRTINVVGVAKSDFEIIPKSLVLPRASSSGPVYSGTCLVRTIGPAPIGLETKLVPLGLSAEIRDGADPRMREIQITVDPKKVRVGLGEDRRKVIQFQLTNGATKSIIDLPVICDL